MEKEIKEFLKLDNRITLRLRIRPLSPLCIKLSCEDKENDSDSLSVFQTTEGGKKIINNSQAKGEKKATEIYKREGEIYIPGSTLKGLFRDRYTTIYGSVDDEKRNRFETDYINELFGHIEDKKREYKTARKSRFFIQDSFLEGKTEKTFEGSNRIEKILLRELFYGKRKKEVLDGENKEKIIKIRAITPIDHFSSKAKVPLQYEYTMESFSSELIINNDKLQDLQGIYFIIRDSWNKEIRIGNSKTRGFGLIKFEVEEFIYEQFRRQEDELKSLEEFFEIKENKGEERFIKFNFSKILYLRNEFKNLYEKDKTPNKFILSLFKSKGGKN